MFFPPELRTTFLKTTLPPATPTHHLLNRDLESAVPKDPKYATCHKVTPEAMAASVTPPGVAAPAAATMPVPKNPIPATRNYEVCNDYGENEKIERGGGAVVFLPYFWFFERESKERKRWQGQKKLSLFFFQKKKKN